MNANANEWDMEVDVLVIGAGGCGLTAAIAAYDAGALVAIVEKRDKPGGNTALSTGSIPGLAAASSEPPGLKIHPKPWSLTCVALPAIMSSETSATNWSRFLLNCANGW
jgi:glycine/D-amino acid oxidase-like deaminating enzyme